LSPSVRNGFQQGDQDDGNRAESMGKNQEKKGALSEKGANDKKIVNISNEKPNALIQEDNNFLKENVLKPRNRVGNISKEE
jgi:hypothetical protein